MSTAEQLKPRQRGAVPSAFEVLREANGIDWQHAQPASAEERRWYQVGYGLKDDYEINEPISKLIPTAYRLWWVLGLTDAKAGAAPRAAWRRFADENAAPSWSPLIFGAAAGITGLGLIIGASMRRKAGI